MTTTPTLVPLPDTQGYEGYYWDDLIEVLGGEGSVDAVRFNEWMRGQTVALLPNNKYLVYRWDWERWLTGLPVID